MSKQEYEVLVPTLSAISAEEVCSPGMPPKDMVQEAEDLHYWASRDKDALSAAGLAPETIDQLMPAAGGLRHAQSVWYNVRFSQAESQKRWSEESDKAYELRDRLIHDMLYALRKNPEALGRVRGVSEGTGNTDMIQDLANLRTIGVEHRAELEKINFDFSLLDSAAETADRMGELLGAANADTAAIRNALDMRDRACTHLKNVMTEIRECGKYVFYRDKKRVHGYTSDYVRKINRSSGKAETPAVMEEPATV